MCTHAHVLKASKAAFAKGTEKRDVEIVFDGACTPTKEVPLEFEPKNVGIAYQGKPTTCARAHTHVLVLHTSVRTVHVHAHACAHTRTHALAHALMEAHACARAHTHTSSHACTNAQTHACGAFMPGNVVTTVRPNSQASQRGVCVGWHIRSADSAQPALFAGAQASVHACTNVCRSVNGADMSFDSLEIHDAITKGVVAKMPVKIVFLTPQ